MINSGDFTGIGDILEIKESGKFEYVLLKRQPMVILN
jgi:hypothetical protein